MRTFKEKLTKVVDQISCDCCGQSCTKEFPTIEPSFDHEYATIEATWGYFSEQDGTKYSVELCESCFNEVLTFLKEKRRKVLGTFTYSYDDDPLNGVKYF
jgi:hypothetical protein